MKTLDLTPAEIAELLDEVLTEFGDERQSKTDWLVSALERHESDDDGERFQRIRAELFRRGVKHSAQL
jgi:hypothetical protein